MNVFVQFLALREPRIFQMINSFLAPLHLIVLKLRQFHLLHFMDLKTLLLLRRRLKYVSLGLSSGLKQYSSTCLVSLGILLLRSVDTFSLRFYGCLWECVWVDMDKTKCKSLKISFEIDLSSFFSFWD